MDRKRSRGRQKIAIQKISKESDCFATFSKRRLGLFKKASEVSTLCSVDIGLLIYSPTGKPFSFFHPTMESVLAQLHNPNQPLSHDTARLIEACSRAKVCQLNEVLNKLAGQLEDEEAREKQLDGEICRTGCGLWDQVVEEMNEEGVGQMRTWLEGLQAQLREEVKIRSFST